MANDDFMAQIRAQRAAEFRDTSPEDLRDILYNDYRAAATSAGAKPVDLRTFEQQIGYDADVYRARGTEAGDYLSSAMQGGASVVGGLGWIGGKLFGVDEEDNRVMQAASRAEEYWGDKQSAGFRHAMAQDGLSLEKVGAAAAGSALPMMVGGGLAAGGTRLALSGARGTKLLAAAKAGDKAAKAKLATIGGVAGGIAEGGIAGGAAAAKNYERVKSLSLDALATSPEFLEILRNTDPSLSDDARIELAKRTLADSIATRSGLQVGASTALLGPIGGGAAIGKFITGKGSGLRGTLAAGARDAGEEGLQTPAEQILGESQMRRADASIDPYKDLGDNALLGAVTGGAFGMAGAQLGRFRRNSERGARIQGLSEESDLLSSPTPAATYDSGADFTGPMPEVYGPPREQFGPPAPSRVLPATGGYEPATPDTRVSPAPLTPLGRAIPGGAPARAPLDFAAPEIAPAQGQTAEDEYYARLAADERRGELTRLLATATSPEQVRAIQSELAALPEPLIPYEPAPLPNAPARTSPQVASSQLQMPEARLPAAQYGIFGDRQYLDQEIEGPLPQAEPDFQLQPNAPVDPRQRELPLAEAGTREPVAPAAPVDERQLSLLPVSPAERAEQLKAELAAPEPKIKDVVSGLSAIAPVSTLRSLPGVKPVLEMPVSQAVPLLQEALRNPRAKEVTKVLTQKVLDELQARQAKRAAVQAELDALAPAPVEAATVETKKGKKQALKAARATLPAETELTALEAKIAETSAKFDALLDRLNKATEDDPEPPTTPTPPKGGKKAPPKKEPAPAPAKKAPALKAVPPPAPKPAPKAEAAPAPAMADLVASAKRLPKAEAAAEAEPVAPVEKSPKPKEKPMRFPSIRKIAPRKEETAAAQPAPRKEGETPQFPGATMREKVDSLFSAEALESAARQSDLSRSILVYMTPDEFLELAQTRSRGADKDKAEGVRAAVEAGEKLDSVPLLSIYTDGETAYVSDHDGRHRADFIKASGLTLMPVRIEAGDIRWGRQFSEKGIDYVEEWPTTLTNQDREKSFPFPLKQSAYKQPAEDRWQSQKKLDGSVEATREGRRFREFFADITRGENNAPDVDASGLNVLNSPRDEKVVSTFMRFSGAFDRHIEASIPGFRDIQFKVAGAISKVFRNADVLDIGASEGALVKTVAELGDGIRAVALDPNQGMKETFEAKPQVENASFTLAALGTKEQEGAVAWEEEGAEIPYFTPDRQFDVVHEAMVFQFISRDREQQIARVKELMKAGGVAIFEEKFTEGDGIPLEQYNQNEADKDAFKRQFFDEKAIKEKSDTVLTGMKANMMSPGEFETVLGKNFKHVVHFWDSGNFRGYMASDDKAKLDAMVEAIGDTSSPFEVVATPRKVSESGQQPLFSINKPSPVTEVFQHLGGVDEAYRTGTSFSSSFKEVLETVMGKERAFEAVIDEAFQSVIIKLEGVGVALFHYDKRATLMHHNPKNLIDIPADSVVVQIMPGFPDSGKGGGLGTVYQAIFNWALNTGRVVRPDSSGLSIINAQRRSEHMISSMLHFGTSEHLQPHPDQYAALAMALGIDVKEGASELEAKNTPNGIKARDLFWKDERAGQTAEERAAIFNANLHNLILASSLMSHGGKRSDQYVINDMPKGLAKLGTWVIDAKGALYEAQTKNGAIRFNPVTDVDAAIPLEVKTRFGVGPTTARRAVLARQAVLGITPASLGNFGRVAAKSVYRYEPGKTLPTPPSRAMAGYPGLAGVQPGQGFWHRLFYSIAPAVQPQTGTVDVQGVVDRITAKWNGAAKVRVVESVSDLPADLQEFIAQEGVPLSGVEGVFLPSTGEILLVSANLHSAERVQEVLAHEAVGHFAMEQTTDMPTLVRQVQALEAGKAPAVVSAAAWVDQNQKNLDPVTRAKEIIAVLAERGEHKRVPFLRKAVASLRAWLRKNGFAKSWVDNMTEDDVLHLLRHAEAYLQDRTAGVKPLLANVPSWADRKQLAPGAAVPGDASVQQALFSVNTNLTREQAKRTVSTSELKAQSWLYSLDQLARSFSKYIPSLPAYYELHGKRDASMTESLKPAEDLFSDWAAWAARNGEQQQLMNEFAVESSRRNMHADRAYRNEAELLADQPWLKGQANAFSDYRALRAVWESQLNADAKKWYATVRDHYSKEWGAVKAELRAFVERQTTPNSPERQSMLDELNREFGRIQGPYFPLMRLGEYLVVAEQPGKERVVVAAETVAQQTAIIADLKAKGYANPVPKVAAEYSQMTDGVPSSFVQALDSMIDSRVGANVVDKDVGAEMKSIINQLYLRSLPDVTGRKMMINRKGVAGAETDLLRVFAKSSYQTAFLKSRLRWQSQIRDALQSIQREVKDITDSNSPAFDPTADSQALSILSNELKARYDLQAQPDPAPLLSKIQAGTYMWYLGLSPAYYATNLLQVPMITIPELAKKYPLPKVLAAMTKAYAKAIPIVARTWWSDSKMFTTSGVVKGAYDFTAAKGLTKAERDMLQRGILDGRLDNTLAYDLGNVAAGSSPAWHKATKAITYMGHTSEVLNRMVTALAAYELSGDLNYTWQSVDNSQFNYSAYNKPRLMNPKWAKGAGVMFQFQQYRQRMVYNVMKAARDAISSDTTLTKDEKREARRYLMFAAGTHFMAAGAVGIPFAMTFIQLINMVLNAAKDDEEPEKDVLLEARSVIAELTSPEAASVVLKGLPRAVNVDLSGRVGAGELGPFARTSGDHKKGKDWFSEQFLATIGGPAGAVLAGWAEAKKLADEGQTGKALATASPRAVRDVLNGYLLATQGVRTGGGYDTGFEPTTPEVFLKTLGLQPGRLAEFQEERGTILRQQREMKDKKSLLKRAWVMAQQEQDYDEAAAVEEQIASYNRAYTRNQLLPSDLRKEMRRRAQLQSDPDFYRGIRMSASDRFIREELQGLYDTEDE